MMTSASQRFRVSDVDPDEPYAMTLPSVGHAVIVNNVSSEMPGTQRDVTALRRAYETLGFRVHVHEDCSAQEMRRIERFLLENDTHSDSNSALLTVICHGNARGELLDRHQRRGWDTETLLARLSEVPALRGKPKILVVQACRGDVWNEGGPAPAPTAGSAPAQDGALSLSGTGSDAGSDLKIGDKRDVFVAFATAPGFKAFGGDEGGSAFLQYWARFLQQEYRTRSLHKIYLMVKQAMARTQQGSARRIQVSEERSTLTHDLFFCRRDETRLPPVKEDWEENPTTPAKPEPEPVRLRLVPRRPAPKAPDSKIQQLQTKLRNLNRESVELKKERREGKIIPEEETQVSRAQAPEKSQETKLKPQIDFAKSDAAFTEPGVNDTKPEVTFPKPEVDVSRLRDDLEKKLQVESARRNQKNDQAPSLPEQMPEFIPMPTPSFPPLSDQVTSASNPAPSLPFYNSAVNQMTTPNSVPHSMYYAPTPLQSQVVNPVPKQWASPVEIPTQYQMPTTLQMPTPIHTPTTFQSPAAVHIPVSAFAQMPTPPQAPFQAPPPAQGVSPSRTVYLELLCSGETGLDAVSAITRLPGSGAVVLVSPGKLHLFHELQEGGATRSYKTVMWTHNTTCGAQGLLVEGQEMLALSCSCCRELRLLDPYTGNNQVVWKKNKQWPEALCLGLATGFGSASGLGPRSGSVLSPGVSATSGFGSTSGLGFTSGTEATSAVLLAKGTNGPVKRLECGKSKFTKTGNDLSVDFPGLTCISMCYVPSQHPSLVLVRKGLEGTNILQAFSLGLGSQGYSSKLWSMKGIQGSSPSGVAYSPHYQVVLVADGGTPARILVLEPLTGSQIQTLPLHPDLGIPEHLLVYDDRLVVVSMFFGQYKISYFRLK